jgi:hypothetical protein
MILLPASDVDQCSAVFIKRSSLLSQVQHVEIYRKLIGHTTSVHLCAVHPQLFFVDGCSVAITVTASTDSTVSVWSSNRSSPLLLLKKVSNDLISDIGFNNVYISDKHFSVFLFTRHTLIFATIPLLLLSDNFSGKTYSVINSEQKESHYVEKIASEFDHEYSSHPAQIDDNLKQNTPLQQKQIVKFRTKNTKLVKVLCSVEQRQQQRFNQLDVVEDSPVNKDFVIHRPEPRRSSMNSVYLIPGSINDQLFC